MAPATDNGALPRRSGRGRLKIFLGATEGVGKTYRMLKQASDEMARGLQVMAGVVHSRERPEIRALCAGFEALRSTSGSCLGEELDTDAALARKPRVLLVEDLAHTNAPGARHLKRWQDVQELLAAGIDVYTTLNVHALESLNDVVTKITGKRVDETVPDRIFEQADEVELVDVAPDQLRARRRERQLPRDEHVPGKATTDAFDRGSFMALRELALRRAADHVDARMRAFRSEAGVSASWPAAERLLVTVGPGSDAEHLVRAARQLASRLDSEWTALYIETPRLQRLPERERDRILGALRLAEELGGKSVVIGGGDIALAVLEFARAQNMSRILVGRPRRRGWKKWIVGSTADRIVAGAHDLDVAIIGAPEGPSKSAAALISRTRDILGIVRPKKRRWHAYIAAGVAVLAATLGGLPMRGTFELSNIVMLYLAGVAFVAAYFGRGPSILTSVLSVAALDFFFVPPIHTLAVADVQYLVTFAVMLIVALVISELAARVRLQARIAGYREERASALYAMSRELAATEKLEDMVRIGVRHVSEVFGSQVVVLLPDANGRLKYPRGTSMFGSLHGADLKAAQWVYEHGVAAGLGTETLADADTAFVPLVTPTKTIGVLALLPANARRVFIPEQRRLLDTFASQIALAVERAQVADAVRIAELRAETEGLRNTLLSAISHELRTPLATIVGASSSLAEAPDTMTEAARRKLAGSVAAEARRMGEIMTKVLDLARLQAGATPVQPAWHPVEEVIGSALSRVAGRLAGHHVTTRLPPRNRLALMDAVLIEQVLANLLENVAKYAPAGSRVNISADFTHQDLLITIVDDGPGFPQGQEQQIFDKFHRGAPQTTPGGAGLGLAICKAIIEAHGGSISAENVPAGGAMFQFSIPQDREPPTIEREPEERTD